MNKQAALAGLFQDRMTGTMKKGTSLPPLELGTIDASMNLVVDGLPKAVTAYMVCRQLTLGKTDDVLTKTQYEGKENDGTHSHGKSGEHSGHADMGVHEHKDEAPHIHDVLIPEKMRKLKPGDRVLVAWASSIPIVIDIVYDRSEMG